MLLRRMMDHVKAQNWTAVWLDFFIVVMGVFIGIQVSNWNGAQNDRKIAKEYIARIQEDLLVTQKEMQTNAAYAVWVKSHIIGAINALEAPNTELGATFIVDSYIAGHKVSGEIQRDTFDELISVGALTKIPDLETRQRILRFYKIARLAEESFKGQSDYQKELRRALPINTVSMLRSNCAAAPDTDLMGILFFQIPETCPPDFTTEQIRQTVTSLSASELLPNLREALGVVVMKEPHYKTVFDAAEELSLFLEVNNN